MGTADMQNRREKKTLPGRRSMNRERLLALPLLCLLLTTSVTSFTLPSLNTRQTVYRNQRQNWKISSSVSFPRQSTLFMTAKMPTGHVAVTLDTPLFPVRESSAKTTSLLWKSFLGVLVSDVTKVALIAFCFALALSVVARSSGESEKSEKSEKEVRSVWKSVRGRLSQLKERVLSPAKAEGVPMTFNSTDSEGWGVCSLRSKRRLGKSSFVQYEFDLPRPDNTLHLELGQQISLCCLDSSNSVAKGEFYLYNGAASKLGTFSILAPNRTPEENTIEMGKDAANFVRVLKQDLNVGDEVALKPGPHKLKYHGQYLPVTDMVYIASGNGIVPIVDQIKAILPSGSSSVRSVTVVWVNEETDDFDVTAEVLEQEYFKHSTKLAVSCVVDNLRTTRFGDNSEVDEAVPPFQPGFMVVVSGSQDVSVGVKQYLKQKGYPDDCICVL